MKTEFTPELRTMLALSAVTYRGFGFTDEASVARKVEPWLAKLPRESGTWRLRWGPGCFRTLTSLFDDAMAYVAERSDPGDRPHFVVAIRGTNPISCFDWIFGDLWVRYLDDWPGATGAHISASTALGLTITQNLTATDPPTASGALASIAMRISSAMQRYAFDVPDLLPEFLLAKAPRLDAVGLLQRLNRLTAPDFEDEVFKGLGEHLDAIERRVVDTTHAPLLEALRSGIVRSRGEGVTLLEFLTRSVPRGSRVSVVGHSKGGALAVAVALWLAEAWAPASGAEIDCFSFAGPTAGDAGFANHYDELLAEKTTSVVNAKDIVPHAWAGADLAKLCDVHPPLGVATNLLAARVDALGYRHVGGKRIVIDGGGEAPTDLVQAIIHHHLDAYLRAAKLDPSVWNANDIFLGR
jgi:hypothetical protein